MPSGLGKSANCKTNKEIWESTKYMFSVVQCVKADVRMQKNRTAERKNNSEQK